MTTKPHWDVPYVTPKDVLDLALWRLVEAKHEMSWYKMFQSDDLWALIPFELQRYTPEGEHYSRLHKEVHDLLCEESERNQRLNEELDRPRRSHGKGHRRAHRVWLKKYMEEWGHGVEDANHNR